ncbi:alkaline phosphatase family protein, partial [Candidatus Aminicenantes bacterium AC-708-M15]|nr:alkaline phosphatase family protein [Candidatus Aminicenantes bacterium AC-708-M15]
IKEKTIWDVLTEYGKTSCLVSIPPSYPPKKVNGYLISCFITPDAEKDYTYPLELKSEIEGKFGSYKFDVKFRTNEKEKLKEETFHMTEQRFEVIKYLLRNKNWDFFMFVEIGVDRIQHAFWKYMDKEHHLYEPNNKFERIIIDYYKFIDEKIGELLSILDDKTSIIVVSDHGAKRMKGAFCINEWLINEGYLVLKNKPSQITSLENVEVDWTKTKAWGWGGYYARVFLNVEGREIGGIIKPKDFEKEREELAQRIKEIKGPNGEKWETKVFKPSDLYPEYRGDYPDLMVYFDDLYWRSAGTLGHPTLYLPENDTGPDDAVHAQEGIYIIYAPWKNVKERKDAHILDIAPTVLNLMDIPIPEDMEGKPIT